ncbi:ARM repeat-containing protein, partial [Ascoidea rubescens DSM 1968]
LGNTVVQKIFDICDNCIKDIMLREVSKYLCQMGIHKNGTWAAQKIINVANSPRQKQIISKSLLPYITPLFKDTFGNYVLQCCLKFGSPWNDFIIEVMLANFWNISQDRFGSRAIRAFLESSDSNFEQTVLLSSVIVLYAEYLATNSNGSLLLTWFLDTCTLSDRHRILAPRLLPHMAQLCTHKLGCLTILKILNNRTDTRGGEIILNALFGEYDPSKPLNSEAGEQ